MMNASSPFRFLSLFSGIEAATVATKPLGWECVAVAEIEPFPCSLLAQRYPSVPNLGDVTTITQSDIESLGHIDAVMFGSPCQDLSVAGKRGGLKGERSGLFFTAMRIVRWSRARYTLFENVPGLFSSNNGSDFAAVVGEMAGVQPDVPNGGWANSGFFLGPEALVEYAVLDAQFFGVPQRRRRIFAVRDTGDWSHRGPIFLERYSLQGHPAPRREAGKDVAPTISARPSGGGGLGTDFDLDGGLIQSTWPAQVAPTLNAHFGDKMGLEDQHALHGAGLFVPGVAHALRGEGLDASEDGTGRGTPLVPVAQMYSIMPQNSGKDYKERRVDVAQPLMAGGPVGGNQGGDFILQPVSAPLTGNAYADRASEEANLIAFSCKDHGADAGAIAPTRRSMGHDGSHANAGGQVAIAISGRARGDDGRGYERPEHMSVDVASTLDGVKVDRVLGPKSMAVRRLTPRECERLQGFPDDYTLVSHRSKDAADGPRYKALGNSWAVPCVRWIAERMLEVDAL